jgi:hypothetical protein
MHLQQGCTIPGCGRPTAKAAGTGFAEHHCRYHVQFKARHGSHWCPTYRAAELKPYATVAREWVRNHRQHPTVAMALAWLEGLLANAGRAEMAQNIKRKPAAERAKVAFARLRDAGIAPERVLAIYLGVSALIEDDRGSHRVREFRIVQVAKALHRLASGTHKSWAFDTGRGVVPVRMDVYPKSSGLVLRVMGEAVEECAGNVSGIALEPILTAKRERYSLHASHLPGWKLLWKRQTKGPEA